MKSRKEMGSNMELKTLVPEAVSWLTDVCQGLNPAHAKPVLCRRTTHPAPAKGSAEPPWRSVMEEVLQSYKSTGLLTCPR